MKNIISFPIRGNPPPCPDGYEQVEGYPFMFQLKFPLCVLRETIKSKCKYKKDITIINCKHFNRAVNPSDCVECKERREV